MAQANESGCRNNPAAGCRCAPGGRAPVRARGVRLLGSDRLSGRLIGRLLIDLSVACLQHYKWPCHRVKFPRFFRPLIFLLALPASWVHAWNGTGHQEVVAVAWSALDKPTRARVDRLLQSQQLIPGTRNQTGEAAWMDAALWPDQLRDRNDTSTSDTPPPSFKEWLRRARTGESTRRWHFADRNVAHSFQQRPHGLLEPALNAQIRLLSDPTLSPHDRAIALAWVSHLVADAHQPLHCASRAVPSQPSEQDAGGNLVTVIDAGRKPPDPIALHRWWDELPGQARPGSARFNKTLIRLLQHSLLLTENDLIQPPILWIEESFNLARTQVYPGLLPDPGLEDTYLIRQDYWLNGRDIMHARLALAGRRLAYVVSQALKDLP